MVVLIEADIRAGHAVVFMCSEHEAFADFVMGLIPDNRQAHVVYIAPGDPAGCPIVMNLLAPEPGVDADRRSGDISSALQRAVGEEAGIGPRTDTILRNAVRALMDYPGGATLLDIVRLCQDDEFRKSVVAHIRDPQVREFWTRTFPETYPRNASAPLASRMDALLHNPSVRHFLCGSTASSFSFSEVVRNQGIVLIDLSRLDRESVIILAELFIALLQNELLTREILTPSERPELRILVDEWPSNVGRAEDSWKTLLARGRKYAGSIVLAAQHCAQVPLSLQREMAGTVGPRASSTSVPRMHVCSAGTCCSRPKMAIRPSRWPSRASSAWPLDRRSFEWPGAAPSRSTSGSPFRSNLVGRLSG